MAEWRAANPVSTLSPVRRLRGTPLLPIAERVPLRNGRADRPEPLHDVADPSVDLDPELAFIHTHHLEG